MKKRITAVISLILAFVMCFALVACNGDDAGTTDNPNNPNNPNKPTTVTSVRADKVVTAFEQLAEVSGFKGEAKIEVSSDKHNYEYTLNFDKRGDRVKCTVDDESYILDLETGNMYTELSDGKYGYKHYLPIGTLDYVEYMLGELPKSDSKLDLSEIKFEYDAETKTANYKKDIARKLNDYLEPLADAYEMGTPIRGLLNDYLEIFTGNDLLTVDGIIGMVVVSKDMTVDDVVSMLGMLGLDDVVDALRGAINDKLDEETATALYNRKVGEIVAGVYNFVMEMIGSQTPNQPLPDEQVTAVDETASDEGKGSVVGKDIIESIIGMQPVIEEKMGELLDAVLYREYTEDQVTEAVNSVVAALDIVLEKGVDYVVDKYVPSISDELYAAIKNGIKFNKLGAEFNIGLEINDDEYTVTGFEITAQFKHSYNGETSKDWKLLGDNNFNAFISVDIGEYYTTAPEAFEVTVSPDAQMPSEVRALVHGIQSADYAVKLELGGKTVTDVTASGAYVVGGDGPIDIELPETGDAVSFDAATGSIVIDKQFINEAFTFSAYGEASTTLTDVDGVETLAITVTLTTADGDVQVTIKLIKMPETVDGLVKMIKNIMSNIPDMPEDMPIEGETEAQS